MVTVAISVPLMTPCSVFCVEPCHNAIIIVCAHHIQYFIIMFGDSCSYKPEMLLCASAST